MPGVAINPAPNNNNTKWMPPPNGSHKSQQPSVSAGSSPRFYDGLSVAEVKQKAKDQVAKETRGVAALTMIKAARVQIHMAREHEAKGDLRMAMSNYIKAALLTKLTMDSQEYALENRGKGVIRKELNDFLETDGRDIMARTSEVEEKLKEIERQSSERTTTTTGKSIKDRLRALQDQGLEIDQPHPPASPRTQQPTPTPSSSTSHRIFVPTSTLGPPSPTSSTSSPPRENYLLNRDELTGFNRAFPSIDDLDRINISLPSAPTAPPLSASSSSSSSTNTKQPLTTKDKDSKPQLRTSDQPISPLVTFRNFAIPIERPSSTPITHTNNAFGHSRPPSPTYTKSSGLSSPLKSSGLASQSLALGSNPNVNPNTNGIPSSSTTPIPQKNTAFPLELQTYLREHNVLLIDVRHRAEFDREHIRANAVVCIEPGVLLRDGITPESLESALIVGPRQESSLFSNRDKFDLVAIYDGSSTSFHPSSPSSNTPISILTRLISEQAFKKMLKRMPMLLIGGIDAWRRDVGEGGLVRGEGYVYERGQGQGQQYQLNQQGGQGGQGGGVEIRKPVPVSPGQAASLASMAGDMYLNASSNAGAGASRSGQPIGHGQSVGHGHHPNASLDQPVSVGHSVSGHSRSPADSVYSGTHSSGSGSGAGSGANGNANATLSRRPAIARPPSSSISFSKSGGNEALHPSMPNGSNTSTSTSTYVPSTSPITYPQFPRRMSPTSSGSGSGSGSGSHSQPNSQPHPAQSQSQPSQLQTQAQSHTQAHTPGPVIYDITSPPLASLNPSQLSSRKRSDFVDQSQEALMGLRSPSFGVGYGIGGGGPGNTSLGMGIDYPELTLSSPTIVRPPPVASPLTLTERQARVQGPYVPPPSLQNKPSSTQLAGSSSHALPNPNANPSTTSTTSNGGAPTNAPRPPRIPSDYPVPFWSDLQIGTSGLKNLGNTCYMNAPIQCLSATVPFARFFTEGRWKGAVNYTNALGSKGRLTGAFASLVHEMWGGDFPYLTPIEFRRSICSLNSQYTNSDQHDSQEFLSFLIDGIHEDLNRIIVKPVHTRTREDEEALERLPPQLASEREWGVWRERNDSLIVDFFQGQFRNRLECVRCAKTSTTYNVFSILSLPIPNMRSSKVPIDKCLDAFFNTEVLDKDDAWDCPRCKTKRPASKTLSLARLPPVLMIHLKRFEANGRFSDKVDTFVDFPLKSLDLTKYMPPPLPAGADRSQLNGGKPMSLDDPRTQIPPYRYDLYAVTNHYGNLSSGHYTAFVASRGGWLYCDDSSLKPVDAKQVVNQKAYVLFYKRARN